MNHEEPLISKNDEYFVPKVVNSAMGYIIYFKQIDKGNNAVTQKL